jgi:hypothetical protein
MLRAHDDMSAVDTPAEKAEAASQRPAGEPSPFAVVGVALAAGVALAKWIGRRGRARPR